MAKSDKLLKAKIAIVMNHPFFATLMLKRKFIEDHNIQTACTNGVQIKFSPKFIDSLTQDEVTGVLAHEILHISLMHHLRRGDRNPKKWNEACDYAINPMLLQSNFKLPQGALINPAYYNMSAEQIYSLLPDGEGEGDGNGKGKPQQGSGKQKQGQQPDNNPGMGDVEDYPAQTKSEMEQAEAQAKQEFAEAMQVAKMAGNMPGGLERLINELMQPQVHWKEVLARFLAEVAHNDYSFSRPNRRFAGQGFIMPSLYNIEMGEVVLMVDTSGSIDEQLLNKFAAEMQEICSMYNSPIKVLYVDAKVCGEQDIDPDDTFKLEPKGGGGTDFRPGFTWLQENGINPKAVVYMTDGLCNDFPKEPEFPVLWALTDNRHFNPPFGENIHID